MNWIRSFRNRDGVRVSIDFSFWIIALALLWQVWHNHEEVVQYLFFLRIPLVTTLFLVGLPLVAIAMLPAMLKNLFVLRTRVEITLVIAAAIVVGKAVILLTAVVLNNAPARFGREWFQMPSSWWDFVVAIALGAPISIAATLLSWRELDGKKAERAKRQKEIVWGVLLGLGLAVLLLLGIYLTTYILEFPALRQATWVLVAWLPEAAKKGYVNASGDGLASGHLAILGFLVEVTIVYICGFFLLNPYQKLQRQSTARKRIELEIPALFYLLLITLILALIFGGLAFALDYYRIPVMTMSLVISILSYWRFNVDHFYKLNQEKQPVKQLDFQQVLASRLQRQTSDDKTLVVVCASGGGIQAAGWTVQVLTGLQQLLGDKFTDAIGLISSVSGGSVGTIFYLDGLSHLNNLSRVSHNKSKQELGQERKQELCRIFERATQDSLDATGWGLAYPDLWRMIGLPFLADKMVDRGTAIEANWKAQMHSPHTSLATWRREIERGEIPIPVFNATIVEDGSRFSICPLKIEKCFRDGCDRKYKDFKTEYPNHDIDATTAARLSATFPYVSPVCRNQPQPETPVYHIADGGFFDNFGVYTALEWLEKCVLSHREQLNIKRVLLLEIDAFPAPVAETPTTDSQSNLKGWLMTALGPLIALLNVRSSTQAARNTIDVVDFQERWQFKSGKQLKIEHCKIQFPDLNQIKASMKQAKTTPFTNREGRYAPPLSWKLTEVEKEAIRQAWEYLVDKPVPEIAKLKALWSNWYPN